jgi:hypothetical protein
MRREIAFAILASALLGPLAPAQPSASRSEKSVAHKRLVTLETVLSCADDQLVDEVFRTDIITATLKLNAVAMVMAANAKRAPDADDVELRSKGFETRPLDKTDIEILPTDFASGHIVPVSNLQFCHYLPIAHYDESGLPPRPHTLEIDGDDWLLNPNEIFAHADQFAFDSGVLTNSSEVFFTAKKGRVSIQFIGKPDGLKFYRALYVPKG